MKYALLSLALITSALAADPTSRPTAYPWEAPVALIPPRARKAWVPCYHVDQRRVDATWRAHNKFIGEIQQQKPAVLFIGDSIMANWHQPGNAVLWKDNFAPLNTYNLGMNGDMTEHVLWRLTSGELEAAPAPKVIVMMIGTNNLWRDTPEATVKGITAILDVIQTKAPESKILLLGLLQRNDREALADFPDKIKSVNDQLSKLDNGSHIRYLSFGDKLLDQDGKPARAFYSDGLHPSPRGYEVWAQQMKPILDEMLKN